MKNSKKIIPIIVILFILILFIILFIFIYKKDKYKYINLYCGDPMVGPLNWCIINDAETVLRFDRDKYTFRFKPVYDHKYFKFAEPNVYRLSFFTKPGQSVTDFCYFNLINYKIIYANLFGQEISNVPIFPTEDVKECSRKIGTVDTCTVCGGGVGGGGGRFYNSSPDVTPIIKKNILKNQNAEFVNEFRDYIRAALCDDNADLCLVPPIHLPTPTERIEFKYNSASAYLCIYFSTLMYKLYNKINNEPREKYPDRFDYPNDAQAISIINSCMPWPGYRCTKLLTYHCKNWFNIEMTYGGCIIEYEEPGLPKATYIVFRGTKTFGEIMEDINFAYTTPSWLIPERLPGAQVAPGGPPIPEGLPIPLLPVLELPPPRPPVPLPPVGVDDIGICTVGDPRCRICLPELACVYSGFNRMYTHTPIIVEGDGSERYGESVRQQVIQYIMTRPIENLFITGHSLGGAIATLLGADIKFNYRKLSNEPGSLYSVAKNNVRVYTFAGPSAGNEVFYRIYDKCLGGANNYTGLFSIVNNRDIVPTLPEYLGYAPPPPQRFCFTSTVCGVEAHKTPTYTKYLIENWQIFNEGAGHNCAKNCGYDCVPELFPPLL